MSEAWFENTHTAPPLPPKITTTTPSSPTTLLRISPTSPHISALVSKFRTTKLSALHTDPKVFVQRYDYEVQHPLSVWETRLARQISVLVCVEARKDDETTLSDDEILLQKEWLGFGAVRGPIAYDTYYPSLEMQQPIPQDPECETRWHLYDLYTFPKYRGNGIAQSLGEGLFRIVVQGTLALGKSIARMRLIVHPKSTWLVDGYTKMGFAKSGVCSLKEGFVANGMGESVPEDTSSTEELRALWETRYGMCMERVVEVGLGGGVK